MQGHLLNLGETSYLEAWDLQRAIAAEVRDGSKPDTIVFLEHPPVVTLGRRTGEDELHVPPGTPVEIVETDRGGRSTFHGPGQLVCYPILDLNRHGRDVRRYCRDLEEALITTLKPFGLQGERVDGLTGVWLLRPPRKIASIGVHISRWVTTHGYALNVDLDPAPFTDWITACGLEDAAFTTMARELGRPLSTRRGASRRSRRRRRGIRPRAGGCHRACAGLDRGPMKRLTVLLILGASISAPATASPSTREVPLLKTFGSRLTKVKNSTTVPVLLPGTLPLGGTYRLYASGSASRSSYVLSLEAAPNCRGANACFVATFEGKRGGRLPGKANLRLAGGDPAIYHLFSCGASCSPTSFWFTHRGVLYSWQVKDLPKGERSILIRMANDAIAAGPR